jgi:hypothetical protein
MSNATAMDDSSTASVAQARWRILRAVLQGVAPEKSDEATATIPLACDAVEAKAKYPLPGIHPTSTSKQKHYIFCRIPIALSDYSHKENLQNGNQSRDTRVTAPRAATSE